MGHDAAAKIAARPTPPEELDDEALLEWHRVCDELAAAGRLDPLDRAALVLYVETWEQYRKAMTHVRKFGAIVRHHNGVAGQSPYYRNSRELAVQLRGLLADLGLTPAARKFKGREGEADGGGDLDF